MGKPKQNKTKYNKIKPCVWGLYANEHKLAGIGSTVSPLRDQMVTVC